MGPQWHRTCLLLPCKSSDSAHDLACGVRRHNLGSEPEGWVKPTLASLFDLVDSVLEMVLASSRAFRSPDPSSYWMTAGAWSVLAAKATYELDVRRYLHWGGHSDTWGYTASLNACVTACSVALPMALLELAMKFVRNLTAKHEREIPIGLSPALTWTLGLTVGAVLAGRPAIRVQYASAKSLSTFRVIHCNPCPTGTPGRLFSPLLRLTLRRTCTGEHGPACYSNPRFVRSKTLKCTQRKLECLRV